MKPEQDYEAAFAGVIGKEYEMLRLICPSAAEISYLVGQAVGEYEAQNGRLEVVELGGAPELRPSPC